MIMSEQFFSNVNVPMNHLDLFKMQTLIQWAWGGSCISTCTTSTQVLPVVQGLQFELQGHGEPPLASLVALCFHSCSNGILIKV